MVCNADSMYLLGIKPGVRPKPCLWRPAGEARLLHRRCQRGLKAGAAAIAETLCGLGMTMLLKSLLCRIIACENCRPRQPPPCCIVQPD
jgi:hypothetical protein